MNALRERVSKTSRFVLVVALLSLAALIVLLIWLVSSWARSGISQPQRDAEVIYISPAGSGELYRQLPGGEPFQLTSTANQVIDYSTSPDGEQIVFSSVNDSGAADLFRVDRDGGSLKRLVECNSARCLRPAWSPDGKRIAYTYARLTANGDIGATTIWTVDASGKQPAPLYREPQVLGDGAFWSPDGTRIAFYDLDRAGIRVVNLTDQTETLIDAEASTAKAWSPDGRFLFYLSTTVDSASETFRAPVYRYDFLTRQAGLFLGGETSEADFSLPVWSPDGQWLAVGIRVVGVVPSQQAWIMRADGSERAQLSDDPVFYHSGFSWHPDGSKLLFQRFEINCADCTPSALVWDRASGATQLVADDISQSGWLP